MRFGSYQFRPSLIPSLATAIIIPLFISLGLWQLDRAEQKQDLKDKYNQRRLQPIVELSNHLLTAKDLQYFTVKVKGILDTKHQFIRENRIYQGRAGYHILIPLWVDGTKQKAVLVNRGWLGVDYKQAIESKIQLPNDLAVEMIGEISQPITGVFHLGNNQTNLNWPRKVQVIDLPAFSQTLGYELLPYLLLLDKQADYGFIREWQPIIYQPEKHLSYALQWFSMAFAVFVIFIIVNWKKIQINHSNN